MRTGLYCYWGALGDHNLNVPGHPLYQLYCLDALAETFNLDKIYFLSFFKTKEEKTLDDVKFFVNDAQRREILSSLRVEIVTFGEALKLVSEVDVAFLKARFRNPSRLLERSFDALKFEALLERANSERCFVIDSDGELPHDFFAKYPVNLLTYFQDHAFYQTYTQAPASIQTIVPALSRHFVRDEPAPLLLRDYDVFFIGNEGLKQPKLTSWLAQLDADGLQVAVQGKWKPQHQFKIYQRTDRRAAYQKFATSLATLQVSKEKYRQFNFLSPRLYEAAVCGVVPIFESGYAAATEFCQADSYVELREKIRCLRDGYQRDFRQIRDEQYQRLEAIEHQLLAAAPQRAQNRQTIAEKQSTNR